MRNSITIICLLAALIACNIACNDDDSFTTSPAAKLTFSADTIDFDTVFSTVPTATKSFWAYNYGADGLRLSSVSLRRGNQTGFRANADGTFLEQAAVAGLEVRAGDSIRIFVELTAPKSGKTEPKTIEDDMLFTLQSGTEQAVHLQADAWDAIALDSLIVESDTTIATPTPLIVRKGIRIAQEATLTILPPTQLFFAAKAGIDVYGSLNIEGRPGQDVVLRGDRTDRMFPYLPYDRVSGQWQGIHIHSTSSHNTIAYADIHSGSYGILCDSADYDSTQVRLALSCTTIHNCAGNGLEAYNANILVANCQITNNAGDCIALYGGQTLIEYSTIAQLYPFSAQRGAALRFANYRQANNYPLHLLQCQNSIITGYADDVLFGERNDTTLCNYLFANSVIRTPKPEAEDTIAFRNVVWENPKDTVQGKEHFRLIDEDNMIYDFHLDSISTARNIAVPVDGLGNDRDGKTRTNNNDAGCYVYN